MSRTLSSALHENTLLEQLQHAFGTYMLVQPCRAGRHAQAFALHHTRRRPGDHSQAAKPRARTCLTSKKYSCTYKAGARGALQGHHHMSIQQ